MLSSGGSPWTTFDAWKYFPRRLQGLVRRLVKPHVAIRNTCWSCWKEVGGWMVQDFTGQGSLEAPKLGSTQVCDGLCSVG